MKKILSTFLSIFLLVALMQTPSVHAASLPISAPTAVLIDAKTNKILYSKNRNVARRPASTTKVLTAIVAVEQLPLNAVVRVPAYATKVEPSKVYLRTGEKYYVKDLIRAILLKSANDAAEVLAYAAGGSRAGFAKMMNRKVKRIGGRNSNFKNPHGLPVKGQYSTAYDMALIMREAQKYPFLVETMKRKTMTIRSLGGRRISLKNHNKMLWRDPREILGKTGWTRRAKHCFVGMARAGSKKVYFAVLGSQSLWKDLKRLVDYRFGNIHQVSRINKKLWNRKQTRQIQTALKRAKYNPGPVDGVFGPKTVDAVKRFQKMNGLRADGIVGKKTWSKLKRHL